MECRGNFASGWVKLSKRHAPDLSALLQLWLSLANNFLTTTGVDWDEVRAVVFSDRLNPDDHKLGRQIIKVNGTDIADKSCVILTQISFRIFIGPAGQD